MKKLVLLITIFLLTGCFYSKPQKFYLDNKYYNKGEYINLKKEELEKLNNESMVVYTYNNFCNLPIHCETIFKEFMEKYKIDFISIPFAELKDIKLFKEISFAPSIIVINNGKIVTYLKSDLDKDYDKYQSVQQFEKWLSEYIYFNKATN